LLTAGCMAESTSCHSMSGNAGSSAVNKMFWRGFHRRF